MIGGPSFEPPVLGPLSLVFGISTSVACRRFEATWPTSSDTRRALYRRARTSGIRRFADQARCNQVRCRSASCDPGMSGSVAVVLELMMVRDEHWLQAGDAPA